MRSPCRSPRWCSHRPQVCALLPRLRARPGHFEVPGNRKSATFHRAGDLRVKADLHVALGQMQSSGAGMGTSPYASYGHESDDRHDKQRC